MDDLLDLNWSASPGGGSANGQKPIPPSQPATSKPAGGGGSQFDFLAKTSGTSSPNYYSTSNTPRSSTPNVRSPPLAAAAAAPPQPTKPVTSSTGNDAFSSLLGMGGGSTGSKNMTLAQRQAQMADEKKRKDEYERQQFAGLGQWDQLGGGNSGSTSSRPAVAVPPLQPTPKKPASSFDALLQPVSRPSSSNSRTSAPKSANTAWQDDDDDFMVGSSSKSTAQAGAGVSPQPADPWDFDQLSAAAPPPSTKNSTQRAKTTGSSSRNGGGSGMRTPDANFDFGEWRDEEEERGILGGSRDSSDDDMPPSRPAARQPARAVPTSKTSARTASPPPHVVGQIVEMGFSPLQARQALAKTSTGIDVQAALDSLLADAFQQPKSQGRTDDLGEADDDYVERERMRREEEEKERRRRRRQGPSREAVRARTPQEQQRDGSGAGTPIQAEQILAQASEIGQNVFSRATSLWNTGKERAMKALDEQRKAYEAQQADSKKGKVKDGRPRWMVEAEEREQSEAMGDAAPPASSGFRDDDDDGDNRPAAAPRQRPVPTNGDRPSSSSSRRPHADPPAERYVSTREKADLLFAEEPKKYVSPARHRKPTAPVPASVPARRTATPSAPLPARTLVTADPSAVQASTAHKTKGNEHFKLGRFTEAEAAYSAGIQQLPEGHLHLVPLRNNRAATRIKLGESTGAAEDCTAVIALIGPAYHPSKEAPLPAELASEIKLAESLVKALTKRAQAWEMGEKWPKAVEDWERIMGLDAIMLGSAATSTRNLAAEGLRRSKRMLDGGSSAPPPPSFESAAAATRKPATPVPSKPSNVNDSEAVATLRAAAKALEAEDQQRLQLKDSVEARLNSWKGGKETNLRALLASLDMVLWDDVLAGGLKVGMHELIAEKQVKIKYMKVIARLHPDKLDVSKTTVEQRMLANGAFGTLNEAWQAFNNA